MTFPLLPLDKRLDRHSDGEFSRAKVYVVQT